MTNEAIREVLEATGKIRIKVGGRSMWPFLPDRSAVVIQAVRPGQIRLGDVALVWTDKKRFLLHRILKITGADPERSVLIKGDRHLTPDGWFPESSVGGVVTEIRFPGFSGLSVSGGILRGLSLAALLLSCGLTFVGARCRRWPAPAETARRLNR